MIVRDIGSFEEMIQNRESEQWTGNELSLFDLGVVKMRIYGLTYCPV